MKPCRSPRHGPAAPAFPGIAAARYLPILAAAVLFTACPGDRPGSGNTPREMFQAVVLSPVPPGVTEIEGVGDTMGGYNLFLRFRADAPSRAKVLARYPYRKADCAAMDFPATLPAGYDRFRGGWRPGAIQKPECHEAEETSNAWSKGGRHRMLVDPESGTVYFTGIGI